MHICTIYVFHTRNFDWLEAGSSLKYFIGTHVNAKNLKSFISRYERARGED